MLLDTKRDAIKIVCLHNKIHLVPLYFHRTINEVIIVFKTGSLLLFLLLEQVVKYMLLLKIRTLSRTQNIYTMLENISYENFCYWKLFDKTKANFLRSTHVKTFLPP